MITYYEAVKLRGPNPKMHRCPFCHGKFAEGSKCCSAEVIWNSREWGTYVKAKQGSIGKDAQLKA